MSSVSHLNWRFHGASINGDKTRRRRPTTGEYRVICLWKVGGQSFATHKSWSENCSCTLGPRACGGGCGELLRGEEEGDRGRTPALTWSLACEDHSDKHLNRWSHGLWKHSEQNLKKEKQESLWKSFHRNTLIFINHYLSKNLKM